MRPTAVDLSCIFKNVKGKLQGIIATHVDDTFWAGNEQFESDSKLTERTFDCQERQYNQFTFAGIQVEQIEDGYLLHQERCTRRIQELERCCIFPEYRSRRQALAWLTNTRPDICAEVNLATQITETLWNQTHARDLNHVIKFVKRTPRRGLMQRKLDVDNLPLKVFSDSSFANAESKRSQLGFIVALCDNTGKEIIIQFCSYKSKRVVRSTMGGEVFAFADGFDYGFSLKHHLQQMIGKRIPLLMYTESDRVFKVIIKNSVTIERQLD